MFKIIKIFKTDILLEKNCSFLLKESQIKTKTDPKPPNFFGCIVSTILNSL